MLHVHRAERADALVDALRSLLATPLADPFAAEVVAVPTRGMERWLTQRMSDRLGATPGRADGVCANVLFPPPRALVGDALAVASGVAPEADAWRAERSVWPLLEVVDACLHEPWLHALAAHLGAAGGGAGDAGRRARRFTAVRHLAELFDRYALDRPDMVSAWAGGRDADGSGGELPADAAWQAELWRRLRARIGEPGPAERLGAACDGLRDEPHLVDLPPRVALFGLTRLPAGHLRVLRALAAGRDVHLFVLHPSPALWRRVAEAKDEGARIVRRSDDVTATLPANRLLRSWGQDARELQLVLGATDEPLADEHHPIAEATGTLLAAIQAGVRGDRPPPGRPPAGGADARPLLDPDDESLRVHACHGRARQVEVLRDAILHVLEADPTLEPRDVIVMCPDIETFAPLIHATFGAGDAPEDEADEDVDGSRGAARAPALHVRLADRALRQTNPVLGVVAQLLDLAEQRVTASEVLDLADREPVRRRFRLDDEDLVRLEDWVAASGIRWGLDAEHRAPYNLDALPAGTWRSGLDRVLVGVTMTEDEPRLFEGVLPLDDVESGAIDLAGRFAELVDRLRAALDALSRPQTLGSWAATIAAAADAVTSCTQRDAWQRAGLERLLEDVVAQAEVAGGAEATTLSLPEARALLAERLRGRPTRANFRTGHVTVCTLMPMRSVPHRVVCLLGLDDGAFPRKAPRDGDDLTVNDPHVGDRDPRTEDRQLLLDALLAATDRLVITYTGNDERTNTPRPPAVPVGELLDVVDRTVRAERGEARDRVVVRHPLQPFDPRNFTVGAIARGRAWSFDGVTLDGARALSAPRAEPAPFLAAPLPAAAAPLVEVEDLVAFAQRPVRAFLRQRLGVSVGEVADEVEDALPVELDALDVWNVGQRLIDALLSGVQPRAAVKAELARGVLPPGLLARPVVERVLPRAEEIVAGARELLPDGAQAGSVDVKVALPGGRTLSGTVPGVCGDVLRTVTYSRVDARHRLALWVRWLALTAARPERPFEAAVVGRARSGAPGAAAVTIARLPVAPGDPAARRALALRELATLVDLYDRGMREPLPLACRTSAAYAQAAAAGRDAAAAATEEWQSAWSYDKEDRALEHQLVHGGVLTFAELLAEPPRADEAGEGWDAAQASRVGRYACRLWAGLLAHEVVTDR